MRSALRAALALLPLPTRADGGVALRLPDLAGLSDGRCWGPARARVDGPGACEVEGPTAGGLLRLLEGVGGSRVPAGPGRG